ncbi:MAG: hypothetical protein GEV05_13880 [Betaproteobacteria bacterium]|nr:hypothetical protein [Betaproteobacteria bacterium]
MRTGLFLLAGLLLLAAFLILGKLFSTNYPGATLTAAIGYIAVWFIVAALNMWIGIAKAGYSVAEELPIFALIFLVPAAVAIVLKWKFL